MSNFIFVTGAAGFIGSQFCKRLLNEKKRVVGLDNINNYYDTKLKNERLKNLESIYKNGWEFYKGNLEDKSLIERIFKKYNPSIVVHLAAQAGSTIPMKILIII